MTQRLRGVTESRQSSMVSLVISHSCRATTAMNSKVCEAQPPFFVFVHVWKALKGQWLRDSHCWVFVFSLEDRASFLRIAGEFRRGLRVDPAHRNFVLVGTKADMEQQRVISKEEAQGLASRLGMDYFETARTFESVSPVFMQCARLAMQNPPRIHHVLTSLLHVVCTFSLIPLLAHRFDSGSMFARLPRDVNLIIALFVWETRYSEFAYWMNIPHQIQAKPSVHKCVLQ